jgi:DNA repair exonuclease SbcCD ATPase subunit
MLFRNLHVENLLGITAAALDLAPVTAVYGPNGAGKTSLADLILHALTGELGRAPDVSALVRQGAKSGDVEVMLDVEGDPVGFRRHRTRGGKGEALVNGVVVKEEEFAQQVLGHLGGDARTLAAAFRSGALLELKAGDLQKMLVALTGARFDADGIAQALADVAPAAQRVGLQLPTTIAGFPDAAARAEKVRLDAHRRAEAVKAKIAGAPALDPELAQQAQSVPLTAIDARLQELRATESTLVRGQQAAEAYAAGRHEEKLAALQQRIAELEAVPKPTGDAPDMVGAEAAANAARKALAAAEAEAERAGRDAAAARARATGPRELPADADALPAQLAAAEAEVNAGEATLAAGRKEGDRLRRMFEHLDAGRTGKACETCDRELTADVRDAIEGKLQRARESYIELQRSHAETVKARDALRTRVAEVEAIRARIAAAAEADRLDAAAAAARAKVPELAATVTTAEARVAALRGSADTWATYRRAQTDLGNALAEQRKLTAVKAPVLPAGDLDETRRRIAEGEKLRAVAVALAGLRTLEAELKQIDEQWADADAVVKACGPKGVLPTLIAEGVGPFTDACNEALAQLAPEFRVGIAAEDFGIVVQVGERTLRPGQLSDGERTRLLYVLQYAVAKLAGVPFLVLDRTELLDDAGKAGLRRLIGACMGAGIQVLMLTCAPAPAAVPVGVTAYRMDAGRAERIGAAKAA